MKDICKKMRTKFFILELFFLLGCFFVQSVYAAEWQGNDNEPPTFNAAAPIHVGRDTQTKAGSIELYSNDFDLPASLTAQGVISTGFCFPGIDGAPNDCIDKWPTGGGVGGGGGPSRLPKWNSAGDGLEDSFFSQNDIDKYAYVDYPLAVFGAISGPSLSTTGIVTINATAGGDKLHLYQGLNGIDDRYGISVDAVKKELNLFSGFGGGFRIRTGGANGASKFFINQDGDVGIGLASTANPQEKLEVAGAVKMNGFRLGTSAVEGQVLTANSSGYGTWQTLPTGSGGGLTGGSSGKLTRWTSTTAVGNSFISETSLGNITIPKPSSGNTLVVSGNVDIQNGTNQALRVGGNVAISNSTNAVSALSVSGGTLLGGNVTVNTSDVSVTRSASTGVGGKITAAEFCFYTPGVAGTDCKTAWPTSGNSLGSGTSDVLPKWDANGTALTDSILSDDGSTFHVSGDIYTPQNAYVDAGLYVGGFRSYGDAYIDGLVGIGTVDPTAELEVNGAIKSTSLDTGDVITASFTLTPTGDATGKVLTADVAGVATWQTLPTPRTYVKQNTLSIGPNTPLHVTCEGGDIATGGGVTNASATRKTESLPVYCSNISNTSSCNSDARTYTSSPNGWRCYQGGSGAVDLTCYVVCLDITP